MSNLFSSGGAGNVGASEGIDQQSLKFNDDESQYLSWTPAAAGNRKTWTWSGWVKRGNVDVTTSVFGSGPDSNNQCFMIFASSGEISFRNEVSNSIKLVQSTALFRDPAAWYHIVAVYDSTNSTSADRMRLYVNGERITDFSNEVQPSQNLDSFMNSSSYEMFIGRQRSDASSYFEGYLSDIHFIDGQALDASSFGETVDGYWKAKDYAGTYGTNGFRLTFQDDVVSEGFNTVTYRGNDATNRISGLGFSPDLVWLKNRDVASTHRLHNSLTYGGPYDAGATGSKYLASNSTAAEASSSANALISLDADGFSVHGTGNDSNDNGEGYVAWCWDAGSGSAASNTDGSITSTVKANPSYGFSIVGWAGTDGSSQTVGHGLGAAPELFIIKNRTTAGQSWLVYTTAIDGSLDFLILEDTDAKTDSGANAPTSSVFSVAGNSSNKSGSNHIAYCFHSVAGYSSIGTYSGTGSSGNAVTGLGFKPAWLMIKRITANGGNWIIWDNTRDANDADVDNPLFPNLSDEEFTSGGTYDIQFDSDGFTINNASYNHNGSGAEFIYMAFADTREAAFWKDVSGQGNNWTPNNLDYRDSLPDSPANNFSVLNAVDKGNNVTLSEGNLAANLVADDAVRSTFHFDIDGSESWYAEMYVSGTPNNSSGIGIVTSTASMDVSGGNAETYWYFANGNKRNVTNVAYGATYTAGDVIGVSVTGGAVTFYKNGSSQGVAFSGLTGSFAFAVAEFNGTSTKFIYNFGQDSTFAGAKTMGAYTDDSELGTFQYQPPAGFKSLCTANLPDPTIVDGSDYFNTVAYTGTGTTNSVTVGFAPDFTWIKQRNTTRDHQLLDIVRGYQSHILYTNLTNAEDVSSSPNFRIDSRDVDGFTVSTPTQVNQSGGTYAAWNWKAGGTAVSNTDGSITSSVSANTDAGFSVVSWTGTGSNATVGHGLSSAPEIIINKNRIDNAGWGVYHSSLGATKYIWLQESNAAATYSNAWNDTSPTSSVFTVGSDGQWNGSGDGMISYCFHSVDGYSKVGSYTGNGSSDGPFVYTGFRPAWVMIKSSAGTSQSWEIRDNKREPFNDASRNVLFADTSGAETVDAFPIDFTSNGFKVRNSGTGTNSSGATYIYLAFAESPFKYATAR